MKDFQKIDWKQYNKPPFYQQWLCRDETLKLATFGDKGLSEVDEHILSLKDQWDLNNAECYFLDRIGKVLDEQRNGNTDDYYRTLLNLRRLLNTNNGSIPSIIKAIKFIYSSEVIHIVPNYPAGLIIEHDGEGTPGLNFNKLLSEIIPAGVSFNTKELFFFTEKVLISDLLEIVVRRKFVEHFGNPIKYNGMIKYDGQTVNKRVGAYGKYDGRFKYHGGLKYNGTGMLTPGYSPNPPFKYSSGIYDKLETILNDRKFIDMHPSIDDSIMFTNFKKNLSDNEVISESHKTATIVDYEDNTKKNIKFNGSIKYDGQYFYSREFVDTLSINSPESTAVETEIMSDDSFYGMRKHHFFNGTYRYNGSIKYDGMALIPLG